MDVGEHRQPKAFAHLCQVRQPLFGASAAERCARASVGFVEACLEYLIDAQLAAETTHLFGDPQHQIAILDHARAGNQTKAHGLSFFDGGC
jgi:hypothetical protein